MGQPNNRCWRPPKPHPSRRKFNELDLERSSAQFNINGTTSMTYKSRGFTIVELLIVIVVIGILAAITIVAYNGIQNRARETSLKSDLVNIAKQIEMYHADGDYPANDTQLQSIK